MTDHLRIIAGVRGLMRLMENDDAATLLAIAASRVVWADLAPDVAGQARDLVIDTLAVMAGGLAAPDYRAFAAAMATGSGAASVIGLDRQAPTEIAAMINAGSTTVLQWQDGHRLARGHPASQLVPVLLALAEETGASGQAVMSAFVAGYEVSARIGIALGGMADALHDAGSWSAIGAAAASAHLLTGGDPAVIGSAIEGAAAVALQPDRAVVLAGAGVHHLYMGLGSVAGLAAARAAVAGLDGMPGSLTRFFGPRAGKAFHAHLLGSGIGAEGFERFELMNAYFKWHPLCAHLSGVADAVQALVDEHDPAPGEIAEVLIESYGYALEYNVAEPTTDLAARFSLPAAAAALLSRRSLAEPMQLSDPLMKRIVVRHDPALDRHYPGGRPAQVMIGMKDGLTLTGGVIHAYGDAGRPMSAGDREAKAQRLFALAGLADPRAAFDAWLAGRSVAPLGQILRG